LFVYFLFVLFVCFVFWLLGEGVVVLVGVRKSCAYAGGGRMNGTLFLVGEVE
jgi:hypothetical protein